MAKRIGIYALATLIFLTASSARAEMTRLEKARFLDKCRGAWAGQMIGVCFGDIYEFKAMGTTIDGPLRPWSPELIARAIGQDDIYVEMTFLKALEDHGLDITHEQAGLAFAETKYPLWHANLYGRENVRRGIMPPLSGHPLYNKHADDIDFQIEADVFGILCPGLPHESNRLGEIFGSIMNYGDGVYGGLFVAGMYAAAYFEDEDVRKVVEAGLACIPEASTYAECIRDTIRWHDENPDNWLDAWRAIEDKWQDDMDCWRGHPFNIDAKLNGTYIVMGLLYGRGDMQRTLEVSTRCGQDADCNPSNAAGVLGCMKGYNALGDHWTGGIAEIEDTPFLFTDYSFKQLIPACQRVTEQIIRRVGGVVEEDAYLIPVQEARPPVTLEQWVDQVSILDLAIPPSEMRLWDPAWRVLACGHDMSPGYHPEVRGRQGVLVLHPVSETEAAAIVANLAIPENATRLEVETASDRNGDHVLKIYLNGQATAEETIDTKGQWTTVSVDISALAGQTVEVRIENVANGWSNEAAYLDSITVH